MVICYVDDGNNRKKYSRWRHDVCILWAGTVFNIAVADGHAGTRVAGALAGAFALGLRVLAVALALAVAAALAAEARLALARAAARTCALALGGARLDVAGAFALALGMAVGWVTLGNQGTA